MRAILKTKDGFQKEIMLEKFKGEIIIPKQYSLHPKEILKKTPKLTPFGEKKFIFAAREEILYYEEI